MKNPSIELVGEVETWEKTSPPLEPVVRKDEDSAGAVVQEFIRRCEEAGRDLGLRGWIIAAMVGYGERMADGAEEALCGGTVDGDGVAQDALFASMMEYRKTETAEMAGAGSPTVH